MHPLAYILLFAKDVWRCCYRYSLGRFEPGAFISQGEGFSLYPFFTYQTGIAFENPDPFFPTTQQIRWAGAQGGARPNKVADRFKSCTRSNSPSHFPVPHHTRSVPTWRSHTVCRGLKNVRPYTLLYKRWLCSAGGRIPRPGSNFVALPIPICHNIPTGW